MTNLFDYVLQYGDLSFEEKEFNEVDNLVFCLISYLERDKLSSNFFPAKISNCCEGRMPSCS